VEKGSRGDSAVVFASVANPPILRLRQAGLAYAQRVRFSRHRSAWLALAGVLIACAALAAAAPAAPEDGDALPRVVPASPDPEADGSLGVAARKALRQGYLVPDQRAYQRRKAQAPGGAGAALTRPLSAEQLAPTTTTAWSGASDAGFAPSDSTGAVGTQRFIELVNSEFAIYDKSSTAPLSTGTLNTLAGVSSADTLFDVQVIWDPTTSRFYYAMIDVESQTRNNLAFGFSKNASPDSGSGSEWCKYTISYGTQFPDFPKLGDSKYYAIIGINVFTGNLFTGSDALAINKPPSGTSCPGSPKLKSKSDLMSNESTLAFTPVPANSIDTKGNGWIAAIPSVLPGKKISLFKVKKDDGEAKIQKTATQLKVNQYGAPKNAPQEGNSIKIDTLDGRPTQAVAAVDPAHNDKFVIWTQHTVSGGAGSRVRWYEIYPSDPKLVQTGTASSSSKYVFNGAISPNRAVKGSDTGGGKKMLLNFNTSSSSSFPTIKMVSKKGNEDQSSQVKVKQSPGPIAGFDCSQSGQPCRWGDYASATPDPAAARRSGTSASGRRATSRPAQRPPIARPPGEA
jgi:hypothetical protein